MVSALAHAYQLLVHVNIDPDDVPVMKAFHRVALEAHPDKASEKGGCSTKRNPHTSEYQLTLTK